MDNTASVLGETPEAVLRALEQLELDSHVVRYETDPEVSGGNLCVMYVSLHRDSADPLSQVANHEPVCL